MLFRNGKLFLLSLFIVYIKASGDDDQTKAATKALPGRSNCGRQTTTRIYGGVATSPTEFSWVALVQYKMNNGNIVFGCAGFLITDRYVVTAAHCISAEYLSKAKIINIRLGEYDTSTDKDCQGQKCNDPPVNVQYESLIPHPNFDDNDMSRHDDIGLIRLKVTVKFTISIRPICLPSAHFRSPVGTGLVVTGFGKTENSNRSPKKLKVTLPVVNVQVCKQTYQKLKVNIVDTQLCAGGEAGKDACVGDSGGPLMRTFCNDTSQWFAEGIVSFGAGCGKEGFPGVYTRVSEYLDFINQNLYG